MLRLVFTFVALVLVSATGAAAQTNFDRTIAFSGSTWLVKHSTEPVGPGPNLFSNDSRNVRVDGRGRLHLRIRRSSGVWSCAEVVSEQSFGYGEYRFYLSSRVDALDPNVVLGLFTWNDDPDFNHRELDVEFSRWGNPADPTNAQYVVQPYDVAGNLVRWTQPYRLRRSTHTFAWQAGSVAFRSLTGHNGSPPDPSYVIAEHTMTDGIPVAGGENARINLWLFGGQAPQNGRTVKVVIEKFEFVALP